MRVIVTRPPRSAQRTAERLMAMGHEPVVLPVSYPQHDPETARDALALPHAALVVTSAEAFQALAGLNLRQHIDTPIFAVGEATAHSAREAGFRHVISGPGDGAALVEVIAAQFGSDVGDLLYLAGQPRSPELEAELIAKGISHRIAECYRMIASRWGDNEASRLEPLPDAVLLYSREAARLFFSQPIIHERLDRLTALKIYCLSNKVAAAVPAQLQATVTVASRPSEDSLLALLSPEAGTIFP